MESELPITKAVTKATRFGLNKDYIIAGLAVALVVAIALLITLGFIYLNSSKQPADNTKIEPTTSAPSTTQPDVITPIAPPAQIATDNPNLTYIENCDGLRIGYDAKVWQKGLGTEIVAKQGDGALEEFSAYNETTVDCKSTLPNDPITANADVDSILMRFYPLGTQQPCWFCDGGVSEAAILYQTLNLQSKDSILNPVTKIEQSSDGSLSSYTYGNVVISKENYSVNGLNGLLITKEQVGPRGNARSTYFAFEASGKLYYVGTGKFFQDDDYYSQIQETNGVVNLNAADTASYELRVKALKEFLANTTLAK